MKNRYLFFLIALVFLAITSAYLLYVFSNKEIQVTYKVISNRGSIVQGVFNNQSDFTYLDGSGNLHRYSDSKNSLISLGSYVGVINLNEDGRYISDTQTAKDTKTNIYKIEDSKSLVKKLNTEVFGWQTGAEYLYISIPNNTALGDTEVEDFTKGQLILANAAGGTERQLAEATASKIFNISGSDYAMVSLDRSLDNSGMPSALFKYNLKNAQRTVVGNPISIGQSRALGDMILFKESSVGNAPTKYVNKNGEIKDTKLNSDINTIARLDNDNLVTIIQDQKGSNFIAKYNLKTQKIKNLFKLNSDIQNPTNLYFKNNKLIVANSSGIWLLEFLNCILL